MSKCQAWAPAPQGGTGTDAFQTFEEHAATTRYVNQIIYYVSLI